MSMTPNATLKPWRKTIRGEKRDRHRHERRTRTRSAPPPRNLDDLTQSLLGTTASMLDEAHHRPVDSMYYVRTGRRTPPIGG